MPRPWFSLAASLILAANAGAATVLKRTVDIVIEPGGKVIETHSLRVRLEAAGDREIWSPYPIAINENRKVEILTAAVEKPDGSRAQVEKKALDTIGVAGEGVLHDSKKYRTVSFPESPVGSILVLAYRTETKPYFPSSQVSLWTSAPTESLQVRITGGGPSFRFRLDGPAVATTLTPGPGGLTLTGTALPMRPELDYASERDAFGPVLRYGWGGPSRWEDVGEWYLGLMAEVPRASAAVQQEALALKSTDDRATIQKLVEHVRTKIRYVAVEVGIGGYRPHPPDEVRTKGWGDCKDKAVLLVEMLGATGIEAFPALILSSEDARVDADFPSADQFNHMIVAIPEARLGPVEGLAVAGGFYFVDPTQETGGLSWFGSSTQDQNALVVKRGASRIVRTPVTAGGDARLGEFQMTPRPAGGFEGKARLNFRGDLASYLLRQASISRAEDFRGEAETMVRTRLPGGEVKFGGWTRGEGDVPEVTFNASVGVALAPATKSLVLPARPFTPPLSILEGREADVVLNVPLATTRWQVELPSGWCAPNSPEVRVENEVGVFRQKVESKDKAVTIERHLEIRQRWLTKALFPKLRELILAEHRAHARSLRFDCAAPVSPEP
jgi:hypothetical protein